MKNCFLKIRALYCVPTLIIFNYFYKKFLSSSFFVDVYGVKNYKTAKNNSFRIGWKTGSSTFDKKQKILQNCRKQ